MLFSVLEPQNFSGFGAEILDLQLKSLYLQIHYQDIRGVAVTFLRAIMRQN